MMVVKLTEPPIRRKRI